ncbi:MAG: PEP-CTERM sorting domain-containing protein [Pirellulales bacterium]|nr:PEP-CTERM sorting domain-containing protein [Pirellulales bacterium]
MTAAPEPSTLALCAIGILIGLWSFRRAAIAVRRSKQHRSAAVAALGPPPRGSPFLRK